MTDGIFFVSDAVSRWLYRRVCIGLQRDWHCKPLCGIECPYHLCIFQLSPQWYVVFLQYTGKMVHSLHDAVFGFLGGKEVQQAGLGNLGLYDREYILPRENMTFIGRPERMALEWVQKYISTFGGDPEKVIM